MRKILGLFMCFLFLLGLTSCGDSGRTDYSKEEFEAAYDECYNGEAKYQTTLTMKINYQGEKDEETAPNNTIAGYYVENASTNQYGFYDEGTDKAYVIANSNKGLVATTKGYENTNPDQKAAFVAMFILQLGGNFTKEDYLAIYDTKKVVYEDMTADCEIRLDDNNHFKQIKITMAYNGITADLIIGFTWDDSVSITLPSTHIHSDACLGYEMLDETYHQIIYNNCGYESSYYEREEHTLDADGKCTKCGYKKIESDENYALAYDELFNGNAHYEIEYKYTSGPFSMTSDIVLAGYYYEQTDFNNPQYLNYYYTKGNKNYIYSQTMDNYNLQIDEYATEEEAKQKFISIFFGFDASSITKEEFIQICQNHDFTQDDNKYKLTAILDSNGHLMHIKNEVYFNGNYSYTIEIDFLWNENTSVTIPEDVIDNAEVVTY